MLATEPPLIAPDGFITSPFNVTILNLYEFFFAKLTALSMSSTITVLPNKFNIIPSYFLSHFTKSDAIPITPSIPFELIPVIFCPLTELIGRKDALPSLFSLKYSTSFFASFSVSVTIF